MKKERILSFIMAVSMAVCQMPFTAFRAFAEEEKAPFAYEKAEYYGEEAPSPEILENSGGKIVLSEVIVENESIEYGFTANIKGEPSFWQDSREFRLDAGSYYFYARVKENEQHLAGQTSMASFKTTISAPLEISYPTPVSLEGKIRLKPTVKGGSGRISYSLEGKLPKGINFQTQTGYFFGEADLETPSFSVSVTGRDKKGNVSNAFIIEFKGKEISPAVSIVCPERLIYGDEGEAVKLQNNVGEVLFAVSGDSVSVDSFGNITILRTGISQIKVTACDSKNTKLEKTFSLEVLPKSLDISMAGEIPDQKYTGLSIEPALSLSDKGITANDYKTTFSNNIYAGKAEVTFTGKENYKGSLKKEFNIVPAEQKPFISSGESLYTGGKKLELSKLVSDVRGEAPLIFTINGVSHGAVLENNVLISGNEAGILSLNLEIPACDINKDGREEFSAFFLQDAVSVEIIKTEEKELAVTQKDVVYGEEIKPEFMIRPGSEISFLYEGKNFKGEKYCESIAPTEAGSYKVTVSFEDAGALYKGNCDFKILKKDIGEAVILADEAEYNGEIRTSHTGKIELDGKDILSFCKVREAEGKNRGPYIVFAEALENSSYKGTASGNFIIKPKKAEAEISFSEEIFYTGEEITPDFKVACEGAVLEEGRDFLLSCENNIFAGEGKAFIKEAPEGNYTFEDKEVSFEIAPANQNPLIKASVKIKTGGNSFELSELMENFKGKVQFTKKGESEAFIKDGSIISGKAPEEFFLDIAIPEIDLNNDGLPEYLSFYKEKALKVEVIQREDASLTVKDENVSVYYGDTYEIKASAKHGNISFNFKNESYDSETKPKDAGKYKVTITAEDNDYYSQKTVDLNILPKEKELKLSGPVEKIYDGNKEIPDGLKLYFDGEYLEGKREILFKEALFKDALAGEEKEVILGEYEGDFKNYTFKLPEVKGSIKKKPVTASIKDKDIEREYSGRENLSAPDLKFYLENNFEEVDIIAVNNKFSDGNAGENKPISIGTLKGKGLNNYEVKYPVVAGSIYPKKIEVWITGPDESFYKSEFSHGAKLRFPQEMAEGDEIEFSVLYDKKAEKPVLAGEYELSAVSENPNYIVKETKKSFEILKAPFNMAKSLTKTVNLKNTENIKIKNEAFGITLPGRWEIESRDEKDVFSLPLNIKDGEINFSLKEGLDRSHRGICAEYKLKFFPEDENYSEAETELFIKTLSGDAANISFTQSENTVTYGETVDYLLSLENKDLKGEVSFYFDGGEEPARVSSVENGEISFTLDRAQLKAGTHTLRAVYDDAEVSLVTEVLKRALSFDVSDLKPESKREGREGETEIYGKLGLEGILEGDEVNLKPDSDLETEGFDEITQSGDHSVYVAGDFEIDNENYQLPKENPEVKAHVNEVMEILVEDEKLTYKILAEKGITAVPSAFEDKIELDSPLKIRETLKYKLTDAGIDAENIEFYDIDVLIKEGESWEKADESFFKKHGKIKIKLPYPEKSERTDEFSGVHMFSGGEDAGKIESLDIKKEKDCITFSLTGLSPVAAGFKEREMSEGSSGTSSHRNKILQDFENEFWESVAEEIYYAYPESVVGVDAIGFDKMNWQVMDALHYNPSVTLVITQYGKDDIVILGEDALEVSAGRIFYKLSYLREVYNKEAENFSSAPEVINPETGGYTVFIEASEIPSFPEEAERKNNRLLPILPVLFLPLAFFVRKRS